MKYPTRLRATDKGGEDIFSGRRPTKREYIHREYSARSARNALTNNAMPCNAREEGQMDREVVGRKRADGMHNN